MRATRRIFAGLASAGLMVLIAPGQAALASTAPGFAARATAFQNSTLRAAMARAPGGVRIGPAQVEWKHYTVLMTVPTAPVKSTLQSNATDSCPAPFIGTRWNCVYDEHYFAGTRLQFSDAGSFQDLWYYAGSNWQTFSWSSTRSQRGWLFEHTDLRHGGYALCMTGNAHAGVYDGPARTDRWIYVSSNQNAC